MNYDDMDKIGIRLKSPEQNNLAIELHCRSVRIISMDLYLNRQTVDFNTAGEWVIHGTLMCIKRQLT
jgi:hypothetical protein